MKKVFIVLVLFFNCIMKGQEKDTTEYFDIEYYKQLPISSKTNLSILPNGDEVQYFKGGNNDIYIIKIKKEDSYNYNKGVF